MSEKSTLTFALGATIVERPDRGAGLNEIGSETVQETGCGTVPTAYANFRAAGRQPLFLHRKSGRAYKNGAASALADAARLTTQLTLLLCASSYYVLPPAATVMMSSPSGEESVGSVSITPLGPALRIKRFLVLDPAPVGSAASFIPSRKIR